MAALRRGKSGKKKSKDKVVPSPLQKVEAQLNKIKCVVVGDTVAEKTRLVSQYATNAADSRKKMYSVIEVVDGNAVQLTLLDASSDEVDNQRLALYEDTDVVMICFSLIDPVSFENVRRKWHAELDLYNIPTSIVVVGTHYEKLSDEQVLKQLREQRLPPVSHQQGTQLASEIGAYCYTEVSAVTQKNLRNTFHLAILAALEHRRVPRDSGKQRAPKSPPDSLRKVPSMHS